MKDNVQKFEKYLFLKRFLSQPKRVGGVFPSSSFLAKKMIRSIDVDCSQHIAELGVGTGRLTEYILKYRTPHTKMYLFEKDPMFLKFLSKKFTEKVEINVKTFEDAFKIKEIFEKDVRTYPDMIVSGIPFAMIETEIRKKFLQDIYDTLSPNGIFVAYQYSLLIYKQLKQMYSSVELDFVFLNFPPAVIYRCRK